MNKNKVVEKMKRDEQWLYKDIFQQKQEMEIKKKIQDKLDLKTVKNRRDIFLKVKLNNIREKIKQSIKEIRESKTKLQKIIKIRQKLENDLKLYPDQKIFLEKNYK